MNVTDTQTDGRMDIGQADTARRHGRAYA